MIKKLTLALLISLTFSGSLTAMDMSGLKGMDTALKDDFVTKLSPLTGLEFANSHSLANLYKMVTPDHFFPHEKLIRQLFFSKLDNHVLLRSVPSLGFQRSFKAKDIGIILRHIYQWEAQGKTASWSGHKELCALNLLKELWEQGSLATLNNDVKSYIGAKESMVKISAEIASLNKAKKLQSGSTTEIDRKILQWSEKKVKIKATISGLRRQIPFNLKSAKRARSDLSKVKSSLKSLTDNIVDFFDPEIELSRESLPANFIYKALLAFPWKDVSITKRDWLEYFRSLETDTFHPLVDTEILNDESETWISKHFNFMLLDQKATNTELTREESLFYYPIKNFEFPSFTSGVSSLAGSVHYTTQIFGKLETVKTSYPPCAEDTLYAVFRALAFNFSTGSTDTEIFSKTFFPRIHPLFEKFLQSYDQNPDSRNDNWQQLTVELTTHLLREGIEPRATYIKSIFAAPSKKSLKTPRKKAFTFDNEFFIPVNHVLNTGNTVIAYSEIRPGPKMMDFLYDLTGVEGKHEFIQRLNIAYKNLSPTQKLAHIREETDNTTHFLLNRSFHEYGRSPCRVGPL